MVSEIIKAWSLLFHGSVYYTSQAKLESIIPAEVWNVSALLQSCAQAEDGCVTHLMLLQIVPAAYHPHLSSISVHLVFLCLRRVSSCTM